MPTPAAVPRPNVSIVSKSGDSAMKIDCSGTAAITTVSAAIGTPAMAPASTPEKRTTRHGTGAPGDRDQHGLSEAHRVHDDPPLMQHQQHADHCQMQCAGPERHADQNGAAHARYHARFFAMRSPSRPCGRKISTMISSVNAIRSRN